MLKFVQIQNQMQMSL